MPSKKKKYNARFPPARIKKIMQTDEEVGKVAAAVPVIISRALELFVESLLKKASVVTTARQARTLSTFHLKQCILAETKFDFLKDLVETIPDRPESVSEDDPSFYDAKPLPSEKPKKKNKSKKLKGDVGCNAGPSNSTGDSESEDEEDDEECEDEVASSEEDNTITDRTENNETETKNMHANNVCETGSSPSNSSQSSGICVAPNNDQQSSIVAPPTQLPAEDDDYDS